MHIKNTIDNFWNGLNHEYKSRLIKLVWNFKDPIVFNNFLRSDWEALGKYNQRRVTKFYLSNSNQIIFGQLVESFDSI